MACGGSSIRASRTIPTCTRPTPEQLKQLGIGVLPQNLLEAIQALEQDEVVQEGLGAPLAKEFIELKRMEWTEYARHVSDWERDRYVEYF